MRKTSNISNMSAAGLPIPGEQNAQKAEKSVLLTQVT
jgi:hypothetical protein